MSLTNQLVYLHPIHEVIMMLLKLNYDSFYKLIRDMHDDLMERLNGPKKTKFSDKLTWRVFWHLHLKLENKLNLSMRWACSHELQKKMGGDLICSEKYSKLHRDLYAPLSDQIWTKLQNPFLAQFKNEFPYD